MLRMTAQCFQNPDVRKTKEVCDLKRLTAWQLDVCEGLAPGRKKFIKDILGANWQHVAMDCILNNSIDSMS